MLRWSDLESLKLVFVMHCKTTCDYYCSCVASLMRPMNALRTHSIDLTTLPPLCVSYCGLLY